MFFFLSLLDNHHESQFHRELLLFWIIILKKFWFFSRESNPYIIDKFMLLLKRKSIYFFSLQRIIMSLQSLQSISLHDNPWTCDCKLRSLHGGHQNFFKHNLQLNNCNLLFIFMFRLAGEVQCSHERPAALSLAQVRNSSFKMSLARVRKFSLK